MSFFFNDTATTEIYTLSLHDALPIFVGEALLEHLPERALEQRLPGLLVADALTQLRARRQRLGQRGEQDRKSTRLNSSHANISYAVFCLKKNKASAIPYRIGRGQTHY